MHLIVAPRNTVNGWERTIRRQYQDYTDPNLFQRVDSSKSGQVALENIKAQVPGYYFVTWQWFTLRPHLFWSQYMFDVVILDECHKIQNRKSKTWAHVRNMKPRLKRIAMSGTFNGNQMSGAWTTLRWLWPETENTSVYSTPLSYWRWVDDWLIVGEDDWSGFTEVQGERFEPGTMLSYYPNYIREADPDDTPGVNEIIVDTALSPEQKRLYKAWKHDLVVWLGTADEAGTLPLVSKAPAQFRMRARQIALAVPEFNSDGKVSYPHDKMKSSKLDAIKSIVNDELPHMEPLLVFTHSKEWAVAATYNLQKAGIPSAAWVGGVSEKHRQFILENWGTNVQVVVAVVEAIAEGIDGIQDVCHNEVWASVSDNPLMNVQARKRTDRLGQVNKVNRWLLVAPDTNDQEIIDNQTTQIHDNNLSLKGK